MSTVVGSLTIAAVGMTSASASYDTGLVRYPYLTDVTTSSVQVNWADTYKNTKGKVAWGTGSACTATGSTTGTTSGTQYTIEATSEYQHSLTISGLSPGATYCYRIFGGNSSNSVDLLGTDTSPSFKTLPSSGAYTFLVFGDWGDNSTATTAANQAKLNALMATSGASFAISTGDIAYNTGTQTEYGDLINTGTRVSQVFGPSYWKAPGATLPLFSTPGNHGRTNTFFQNWPEPGATAETGERYGLMGYSSVDGNSPSTGPAVWYAFDVAGVRNYVLTADWSDTNTGDADGALCGTQFAGRTCKDYQVEADTHWKPGAAEYEWLKADLASHPGQLKMAFFHYPLRSDVSTEPDDAYLQNRPDNPIGSANLERLLYDNGVKLAFNGHAHVYQRNIAPPGGIVSYVTGGAGAKLTTIAKGSVVHCSTTDAYGLGWSESSNSGSYCGGAGAKPTSASKVNHFLTVTVSGSSITVTPTNADNGTFDSKTYDFGSDSTNPTSPSSVTATYVGGSKPYASVTWTGATDNGSGLAAYDVYREAPGSNQRTYLSTVLPEIRNYHDLTATSGTAYVYSVDSRDQAGNTATASAAPLGGGGGGGGGTVTSFGPVADARVSQASPSNNYGSATTLSADLDSANQLESYLRFDTSGVSGTITGATLKVWTTTGSTSPSNNGPAVRGVADTTWAESGINWANKPAQNSEVANVGAIGADILVSYDVTSYVKGLAKGPLSMALAPDSADGASFNSRESSASTKRPVLEITTTP